MFDPPMRSALHVALLLTAGDGCTMPCRATRALHFGGSSIEAAINWIDQHGDDPEVNEPLLVKPEVRAVGGSMPCSHPFKLI